MQGCHASIGFEMVFLSGPVLSYEHDHCFTSFGSVFSPLGLFNL